MLKRLAIPCLVAVGLMPMVGVAQFDKEAKVPGRISFSTRIGSWRLIQRNEADPVNGELEFSFTGTLLINQPAKGAIVTVSGNIHKEYQSEKGGRVVYNGTGKLYFKGQAKAIQWFGRDMQGTYYGRGVFKFYGEFDDKQETGAYWYGALTDTKAKRKAWGIYGMDGVVPENVANMGGSTGPVKRRKIGG